MDYIAGIALFAIGVGFGYWLAFLHVSKYLGDLTMTMQQSHSLLFGLVNSIMTHKFSDNIDQEVSDDIETS